ncbi:MAG: pilus assembly protein PilM [Candidatus Omnitrophica bacterium]|nr:pilus assembly protein PilM [Candidatus Omnitrophota bacterium]
MEGDSAVEPQGTDMHSILLKFKNFFPKNDTSAGLDIGTHSVKAVKLKFNQNEAELQGFNITAVGQSLPQALKASASALSVTSANISLSGPSVIIRYAEFPRMQAVELKQSLKFEAPKHIPFSVNEVNLDAHILKPSLADNKMLVLLAAVKKDFMNQRIKAIQDAGIRVAFVDIDSLALVNAFNYNYAKEQESLKHRALALLNIGNSMTNLNIIEDKLPYLSRDIPIGANNFKQEDKGTTGASDALFSNLAAQIRTSFDYYESQSASTLAKIFLSGAGSLSAGLKEALAGILRIEVEYWDPLKKIKIDKKIESQGLKERSGQLAVAIGLALRR